MPLFPFPRDPTMPDPSRYPLDFRPTSYRGGVAELLARIQGAARRRMVEDAIRAGRLAGVPEPLLGEKAPEDYRRAVELEDFRNMGGEYLPRLRPNEVEVARVEMPATTTHDVVSVRAREVKNGYRYVVVDEYESKFRCSPGWTKLPLTLGQLVRLIDSAEVPEEDGIGIFHARYWAVTEEGRDPGDFRHFYRVTSPFYPDLGRWYDEDAAEWVADAVRDWAG